jgi:hypothetical protein
MAKPHLTEFLLKLATDAALLEKYRAGGKHQRIGLMEAAGLSASQQEAVLSANTRQITGEIEKELEREGAKPHEGNGNHLHVQLYVQLPPE